MNDVNILSLAVFVLIATFTPGPNNISSASHGLRFGYAATLPYMAGIIAGFYMLMGLCMSFTALLSELLLEYNLFIRILGAGYISWLALKSLGISYSIDAEEAQKSRFSHGFFLQLVNMKAILFGITIFSTFLMPLNGQFSLLLLFVSAFALSTFIAISLWALSGAWIGENLKNEKLQKAVNMVLAASLLFIAVDILDFF